MVSCRPLVLVRHAASRPRGRRMLLTTCIVFFLRSALRSSRPIITNPITRFLRQPKVHHDEQFVTQESKSDEFGSGSPIIEKQFQTKPATLIVPRVTQLRAVNIQAHCGLETGARVVKTRDLLGVRPLCSATQATWGGTYSRLNRLEHEPHTHKKNRSCIGATWLRVRGAHITLFVSNPDGSQCY